MATKSRSTPQLRLPPRSVAPDSIDFRDRVYAPPVEHAPPPHVLPAAVSLHPVLNQASTDACTGFALATVIHALLARRDRKLAAQVSPFMLYGMARHYDNLPGTSAANGSTCRGVLKGWFKHGACDVEFWPRLAEPKATGKVDWWDDGVKRPLGAYYRVERRSVVDMQAALNETGVLLASADTHPGWDLGSKLKAKKSKSIWVIPFGTPASGGGGHAFAILGYTIDGFIIQNSWGEGWGSKGLAILTYADWLSNSWDCWVAQLGVVTRLHEAAADGKPVLRHGVRGVHTGVLDVHGISPYVINTGNDGELSQSGQFHTTPADIDELVKFMIPEQRRQWDIGIDQKMDVVVYAHGGLVDEHAAANTAALWIELLKAKKIFPIFLMWESGILETIEDVIKDAVKGRAERPAGGPLDALDGWWSDRVEGAARLLGKDLWDQMKENARLLTQNPNGGANLLFQRFDGNAAGVRLHLVGHSAGAVIHAYLADWLINQKGWTIDSLSLLAPACRMDVFRQSLLPHVRSRTIDRMAQFHLSDPVEDNEGGMRVALGYKRSLLYLISNGLEEARHVPILGMQKYFDRDVAPLNFPNVEARVAPTSQATHAMKHGAFDDDRNTQDGVVANIRGGVITAP